jgi:hypothetical protein
LFLRLGWSVVRIEAQITVKILWHLWLKGR